ncbi:hypothetical protein Pcinc_031470, partial [Petrolisthes cinctipes]
PLRANLMSSHAEAVSLLEKDLATLSDWDVAARVRERPGRHLVAWMASHCPTRSRREEYITLLQRYIPVHSYGRCGNLTCIRGSSLGGRCWQETLQYNYSFYLAFENSLCDHYITEKLYNPLVFHIVPVVWGGADYSQYLPPHSYIDARQYSPYELATLLMRLHTHPEEYAR